MTDVEMRFWDKVKIGDGCWEWAGALSPKSYGKFNGSRRDGVRQAHRVSWAFANGDAGKLHVLHRCDNPRCVRVSHLFIGTNADNMADKAAKGRKWRKTSDDDVREIRRLVASGETQVSVAAKFGLTQAGVSRLVLRKAQGDVK